MILLLFTILLVSGLGSLSSSAPRQFHVVKEKKTWTEAQQYCREKFTDLATIDDMTENEKVKKTMIDDAGVGKAWIGLRNVSSPKWLWSLADKDFYRENEAEFRVWAPGQPDKDGGCVLATNKGGNWYDETCSRPSSFICYEEPNSPGVVCTQIRASGQWNDAGCHYRLPFICYEEPEVKRQIVRVSFPVASPESMNDPAVQQAILQQIKQRLREKGMPEDAKLTWITQPDGEVFKEEKKKEKKEEGSKRRKKTEL